MDMPLALICAHYGPRLPNGSKKCSPEVIDAFSMREGPAQLWPSGSQLDKINNICKRCPERLFGIEEKICPACGSTEFIKEVGPAKIESDSKPIAEIVFMECKKCSARVRLKINKLV